MLLFFFFSKRECNFLHSEPVPRFLSLRLYSWQPPTVCLFNVFTELLVAIYPVVPPCQSSGVRANWHSRCSIADRPICSDSYPSQEGFMLGGKGEKPSYCRDAAWISIRQRGCVYFWRQQGTGACKSKERTIHTTEMSAVGWKTYLCKHCSTCHLVISVHWRCSWAPDKFLWLSPSDRSGRDRKEAKHCNFIAGVTCVKVYILINTIFTRKATHNFRQTWYNLVCSGAPVPSRPSPKPRIITSRIDIYWKTKFPKWRIT